MTINIEHKAVVEHNDFMLNEENSIKSSLRFSRNNCLRKKKRRWKIRKKLSGFDPRLANCLHENKVS